MTEAGRDRRHVHPPPPRGRGPRRPGRRARRRRATSCPARPPSCPGGSGRRRSSASAPTTRPPSSTASSGAAGVVSASSPTATGRSTVVDRRPRPCARARLRPRRRRRAGHAGRARTSRPLEDLYFAVRGHSRRAAAARRDRHRGVARPSPAPTSASSSRPKDFWGPDGRPRRAVLLRHPDDPAARHHAGRQTSGIVEQLVDHPRGAAAARRRTRVQGDTPTAQAGYALAVYLFAPVAVVVPLTISTAVGARDDRRRARAGHRRVPRPLPRRRARDLPREADRQPGARASSPCSSGFGALLADRQHRSSAPRSAAGSSPRPSGGC